MSETRQKKAPTSVTVEKPTQPLPAPPDPPPGPPEEEQRRSKTLLNLNFAILRMHKELAYFLNQFDSAWETVPDFDELPRLKEISIAGKALAEVLKEKVEVDNLDVPKQPRPQSTQHIVSRAE